MTYSKVCVRKEAPESSCTRRSALAKLLVSGGAAAVVPVLPGRWHKPVVDSVLLPAHAQTSGDVASDGGSALSGCLSSIPGVTANCPHDLGDPGVTTEDFFRILDDPSCTVVTGSGPGAIRIAATSNSTITESSFVRVVDEPELINETFTNRVDDLFLTVETTSLTGSVLDNRIVAFRCPNIRVITNCIFTPDGGVTTVPCPPELDTTGTVDPPSNSPGVLSSSPDPAGPFTLNAVDDSGNPRTISGTVSVTGSSMTLSTLTVS